MLHRSKSSNGLLSRYGTAGSLAAVTAMFAQVFPSVQTQPTSGRERAEQQERAGISAGY